MTAPPAHPGDDRSDWPELPYDAWRDTRDTLHMYTQVIGKVRLALAPMEPQWAQVPLYVTARGLNTSPIPHEHGAFDIDVDLIGHQVAVRTAQGDTETIALRPRPVAEFYEELLAALARVGRPTAITPGPSEVPDPIPFAQDTTHASYDAEWATRFFRALSVIDLVFKEHHAEFRGRTTPVHFFWGSFDLALTRFSGRAATPTGTDVIMRLSTDAEQICAGWWPGHAGFPEPAFFGYAYPKPDGIEDPPVEPAAAFWSQDIGEWILRYDDIRAAESPRAALLSFLRSTYAAAAARSGWARDLLPGEAAPA